MKKNPELLISRQNSLISPSSDVLTYLDTSTAHNGVYESIRTYNRIPFRLDQHLGRLQVSADKMNLKLPQSIPTIQEWVLNTIGQSPFDPQFIKLVATSKDIFVFSRKLEFDHKIYEGVRGITAPVVRENPEIKQLDVISQHKARMLAQAAHAYEALIYDEEKNITEGAYSNLFWKIDEQWFTCRKQALPGITQAAVIEIAGAEYKINEGTLPLSNISRIEECFLTQTSKGIVPIIQIDDISIGNGTIGPQTKRFMKRFEDLTQTS